MDPRKIFLFFVLISLVLPFGLAEVSHNFVVNKYFFQYPSYVSAIVVQPLVTEAAIKPCEPANFSFRLFNPTTNNQVYDFSVEGFEGKAYISHNTILSGGQSKIFHFVMIPDCSLYGHVNPFIIIETEEESAKLPILFQIEKSYEYSVIFPQNLTVCNIIDTYARLEITNNAGFENEYTITTNKDWFKPLPTMISLHSGQKGYVDLQIAPNFYTDIITTVSLLVKPKYGDAASYNLYLTSENCYGQEFRLLQSKTCNQDGYLEFELKNIGKNPTEYQLYVESEAFSINQTKYQLMPGETIKPVLNLVPNIQPGIYNLKVISYIDGFELLTEEITKEVEVLALSKCYEPNLVTRNIRLPHGESSSALIIKNKGLGDELFELEIIEPYWLSVQEENVFIPREGQGAVKVFSYVPMTVKNGRYDAALLIKSVSTNSEYVQTFQVVVSDTTLWECVLNNWCLIVFVVLIVIAMIFLIRFIFGLNYSDLAVFFLLLLLAAGLTLICFNKFVEVLNLQYHPFDEESNICPYSERICSSEYYIRFKEDTVYRLNLSNWFYDPDGDVLEYGLPWHDHIAFLLNGNQLLIKPDKDWYGVAEVIFSADDNQGGFVESRTFYIHVLNTKEFYFSDFLLQYHVILSISAMILFLGLLIAAIFLIRKPKSN